ncbi:FISUMP domain-containing protein [Roseobacteraceae bacterium S113]
MRAIDQGNPYRLVEIGDQCWFADNLKEIPSTDQGWYGFYEDADEEPAPGEGMLYTWDAAMNGGTRERAQGICPTGWHIPSECEVSKSFLPALISYGNPIQIKKAELEQHPFTYSSVIGKRGLPWNGLSTSSWSRKESGSATFFLTGPGEKYVALAAISQTRANYSCIKD